MLSIENVKAEQKHQDVLPAQVDGSIKASVDWQERANISAGLCILFVFYK